MAFPSVREGNQAIAGGHGMAGMSDFSQSASAGGWIVSRSAKAPTPAPSPNQHNPAMGSMPCGKPFQCGICYDFLSHSVDELDEHVMKHKRDLADRLHNRAQSEADRREYVHVNQNHQQMLYYADGTHAGTQAQGYEYQAQSCSAQVQQYQEYRPHDTECKSASKYYAHHPALLSHHRPVEQAASTGMTEMYASECAGRQDGNVASGSIQHDYYAASLAKRGRYETNVYEREDQHQRHATRPDLNEENTADADPSSDHHKGESEYGPVSFAEAQQGDSIIYHELQSIKSENVSTDREAERSGVVTENFGSGQEESAHEHETNGDGASRMHDNGGKLADVQSSKDSEGNDIEADPSAESSSKTLDMLGDGSTRSDNESSKSHEDHSMKCNSSDVGQNGRVPRTRRSARMQTSRR